MNQRPARRGFHPHAGPLCAACLVHGTEIRVDAPRERTCRRWPWVVELVLGGQGEGTGGAGQDGDLRRSDGQARRRADGRGTEQEQRFGDAPFAAVGGMVDDRSAHPGGGRAAAIQVHGVGAAQLAHQLRQLDERHADADTRLAPIDRDEEQPPAAEPDGRPRRASAHDVWLESFSVLLHHHAPVPD